MSMSMQLPYFAEHESHPTLKATDAMLRFDHSRCCAAVVKLHQVEAMAHWTHEGVAWASSVSVYCSGGSQPRCCVWTGARQARLIC